MAHSTDPSITIQLAMPEDIDGILSLEAENKIARGGLLVSSLTSEYLSAILNELPLIIAKQSDRVHGFLIISDQQMNRDSPIMQAMLSVYSASPDAWICGPVCVRSEFRGMGLFRAMVTRLKQELAGGDVVLFIRADNSASVRAHTSVGFRQVASFAFGGIHS